MNYRIYIFKNEQCGSNHTSNMSNVAFERNFKVDFHFHRKHNWINKTRLHTSMVFTPVRSCMFFLHYLQRITFKNVNKKTTTHSSHSIKSTFGKSSFMPWVKKPVWTDWTQLLLASSHLFDFFQNTTFFCWERDHSGWGKCVG